ncbi:MAG TPA: ester cyclase [Sporichthya sp.]|nr:ester cyclase [Sporichthya sp.]
MTSTATAGAAISAARLADEFLVHCLSPVSPGAVDRFSTDPKVRAIYAAAAEAFPDSCFVPAWRVVEGNRAVLGGVVRGTHAGTFRGVPATGRSVEMLAVVMIECRNGTVVDLMVLPDTLAMAEQIGLLDPLGPKACEPFKDR